MTNALQSALERLWGAQAKPQRDGDDDILGELIRMVLSQATSRSNAAQAFSNLLDTFHGDWEAVRTAPVDRVIEAIEVGGLARQKAPRLQALLTRVRDDFGEETLEALRDWEPPRALKYLIALDGVGPTTANYALMEAAGMHLFPINGGIRRVLERLGVVEEGVSDVAAHEMCLEWIEEGDAYAAHVALLRHARSICTARSPRCEQCVLNVQCPSANLQRG